MNRGWREVALGDVLNFSNGASSPDRSDDLPYPVYGSNGILGFTGETNTNSNTIVIGRVGSCGALHFSKKPCWVTDNAIRGSTVEGNDPKFLFYLLHTLRLNNRRTGSAQPLINQNTLSSISILIPPLPEQRSIAYILGTLDDKIDLNNRMNQTLEEMAQALFKFWFIDFGPVRAKMESRWHRGQSLPGLPADCYDLFPDRLVQSELGEIPEGWEVKPLDEIAKFQNGLALQKFRPTGNENRLPVVKISQLRNGHAEGAEWAIDSINPDCIIDDGDVVFSWSGSLLVKVWRGGRAALNQHLFKVTSTQYPKWFYLKCTELHLAEFQEIAAGKATTMGHIKREHLKSAKCVVPNQEIFSAVDGIFSKLLARQNSADLQSRSLAAQRKVLLPKLVGGKVNFLNTR